MSPHFVLGIHGLVRAQSHQIHHGEQHFFSSNLESKSDIWITRVVAMSLYWLSYPSWRAFGVGECWIRLDEFWLY